LGRRSDQVQIGLADGLTLTMPKGPRLKSWTPGITLWNRHQGTYCRQVDVLGQVEVRMGDEIVHKLRAL